MFLHSSWAWYARSSKLYLFASVTVNEPEPTLCRSVQAFYETPLLGEGALAGSERWLLSCLQELYCGSLSAAQPYMQEWSHCGICIQFTYSRKTLGCLSCAYSSWTKLWFKWRTYSAQKRCWAWPACRRRSTWRFTHSTLSHTEAGHGCSTTVLIIA